MTEPLIECLSGDGTTLTVFVLHGQRLCLRLESWHGEVQSIHLSRADALRLSASLAEFAMQGGGQQMRFVCATDGETHVCDVGPVTSDRRIIGIRNQRYRYDGHELVPDASVTVHLSLAQVVELVGVLGDFLLQPE